MPVKNYIFLCAVIGMFLFVLQAQRALAAPLIEQTCWGRGFGVTTQGCDASNGNGSPFASNVAAGDLIFAIGIDDNVSTGTISGCGLTWNILQTYDPGGVADGIGNGGYVSAYATTSAATSCDPAITETSSTGAIYIWAMDISGLSGVVDVSSSSFNNNHQSTYATPAITTTRNGDFVVSELQGTVNNVFSVGSPFATTTLDSTSALNAVSTYSQSTAGAISATYTYVSGGYQADEILETDAFETNSTAATPPTEYWFNGVIKMIGTFIFH